MKQATPTQSTIKTVLKQVRSGTPLIVVEQIAAQIDRSVDAKARIEREGLVVRDMKGSVIPHPAIKIEQDACKLIVEILSRWKK